MTTALKRRLLTIDEYHRMVEAGILTEQDKVELLNGEIIEMSPIGSEHGACVKRLNALFNRILAGRVIVSVQDPVQIPALSEPDPDIALLLPRPDFYFQAHPLPQDVLLIIEVADSSYYEDRQVKLPIYAQSGIPEYWIIHLAKRQIEIFRGPQKEGYQFESVARPGESVHLASFDLEISFEELLGPTGP